MSERYVIVIAGLDKQGVQFIEAKAQAVDEMCLRDGEQGCAWHVMTAEEHAETILSDHAPLREQVATLTSERDRLLACVAEWQTSCAERTKERDQAQQMLDGAGLMADKRIQEIHALTEEREQHKRIVADLKAQIEQERAQRADLLREQDRAVADLKSDLIQAQTDRDVARSITERARHEASAAKKELVEARTAFDHKIRIADAALVKARDVGAATVGEQLADREEIKRLKQELGVAKGDIHALEVDLSKEREEHAKVRKNRRWHRKGKTAAVGAIMEEREQHKRVVADLKAQIDAERATAQARDNELREELRHVKDQLRMARAGKEPKAPGPCVQELRAEILALQETLRHTTRALAALASDRRER